MDPTKDEDVLPGYPRLSPETRVKLTREWSAAAWAGAPERLVAVQREAESALERVYADRVRALPEDSSTTVLQAQQLGESLRLRVRATGNDRRLTRSGELSAIFAETDLSEIEEVRIWNEGLVVNVPVIDIKFRRKPADGKAVKLDVSGPDRQWVGGVAELLSGELSKCVPWWSVLRHGLLAVLLGVLLGWGLAGLLLATVADNPRQSLDGAIVLGTLGGGLAGGFFIFALLREMFPGFEVVEPGGSPQGRKVIGGLVTVAGFGLGVAGLVVGLLAL